jgi:hypothetical protein
MRHRQTASLPERYPSIPPTRHRAASLSTSIDTSVHVCVSNSLPKGTTLDPPPIELPPARRRRFVALRRSRKAEVKSLDAIVVRSVVVNGALTRCKLPLFSLEENSYKEALPAQPPRGSRSNQHPSHGGLHPLSCFVSCQSVSHTDPSPPGGRVSSLICVAVSQQNYNGVQ